MALALALMGCQSGRNVQASVDLTGDDYVVVVLSTEDRAQLHRVTIAGNRYRVVWVAVSKETVVQLMEVLGALPEGLTEPPVAPPGP